MGLCKCPKRKVTNQFCFEHRVNVCENCMVSNHPKCIVQSYCQWLKDSDYSSLCGICNGDLSHDECVRLICYHVFHIKCLDEHCRQYPSNTAPAGFMCPTCSNPIFPAPNLVSPVADKLRAIISNKAWAREGLGLPLLPADSESIEPKPKPKEVQHKEDGPPYSVIDVESTNTFHRNEVTAPPKRSPMLLSGRDHDENKYKRRPPWGAFKRLLSNMLQANPRNRHGQKFNRRQIFLIVMGILAVVFFVAVSSRVFHSGEDLASPMDAPFNHKIESN